MSVSGSVKDKILFLPVEISKTFLLSADPFEVDPKLLSNPISNC